MYSSTNNGRKIDKQPTCTLSQVQLASAHNLRMNVRQLQQQNSRITIQRSMVVSAAKRKSNPTKFQITFPSYFMLAWKKISLSIWRETGNRNSKLLPAARSLLSLSLLLFWPAAFCRLSFSVWGLVFHLWTRLNLPTWIIAFILNFTIHIRTLLFFALHHFNRIVKTFSRLFYFQIQEPSHNNKIHCLTHEPRFFFIFRRVSTWLFRSIWRLIRVFMVHFLKLKTQ